MKIKESLSKLSTGLIWPAIAGNVIWALINSFGMDCHGDEFLPKLLTLGALSFYLMVYWLNLFPQNSSISWRYILMDWGFATALVLFTITIATDKPTWIMPDVWFLSMFIFLLLGYALKIWNEKFQVCMSLITLAGTIVICLSVFVEQISWRWWRVCVLVSVLACWCIVLLRQNQGKTCP